jgi:hypothetical protein
MGSRRTIGRGGVNGQLNVGEFPRIPGIAVLVNAVGDDRLVRFDPQARNEQHAGGDKGQRDADEGALGPTGHLRYGTD